jgi:hypothetical protein
MIILKLTSLCILAESKTKTNNNFIWMDCTLSINIILLVLLLTIISFKISPRQEVTLLIKLDFSGKEI